MDELNSLYEKKVDAILSKMFGDKPSELKMITKLTLMNNVLTEEMKETLLAIRENNLKEAKMIEEEMTMTLDASGNVVPLPLPLLEKAEQNSTFEKVEQNSTFEKVEQNSTFEKVEQNCDEVLSPRQEDMKVIYHDN